MLFSPDRVQADMSAVPPQGVLWTVSAVYIFIYLISIFHTDRGFATCPAKKVILVSQPGNYKRFDKTIPTKREAVYPSGFLPPWEAIPLAGAYCIPLVNFKSDEEYKVSDRIEIVMFFYQVASFILLTLFGVSVTANLIRTKK
jgi:hypothetical protein